MDTLCIEGSYNIGKKLKLEAMDTGNDSTFVLLTLVPLHFT